MCVEEEISNQTSNRIAILETRSIPKEQKIVSQRQVIKNLTVICVGFVILFTAYNGLSMLQSTMNQKQGIGVASQAIIYAGFCISALLFPKYTIQKIGCKLTLLLSMSCYIPYIAANFYFNWITMVPSAFLLGLAASLLWSAECTYFNESSSIYSTLALEKNHDKEKSLKLDVPSGNCYLTRYEKIDFSSTEKQGNYVNFEALNANELQNDAIRRTQILNNVSLNKLVKDIGNKEINSITGSTLATVKLNNLRNIEDRKATKNLRVPDPDEYSKLVSSVTARFFGLFGMVYRTSDIWSNLMSYYVLADNNISDNITESGNCSCGASFCNAESNCFEHNLAEPSQHMRNILTGVSVLISVFAVLLVFLFLDDLGSDKKTVKFSFNLAMATCKFVRRKEAVLLLPLSTYIGLQQGFYIGDFTKSYIACSWGVYHVGLVTICYGVAGGISSTLAGVLVKHIGRIPVMLFGILMNHAASIFLLVWNPLPNQSTELFASAAMWGISVGILWSQLRAFYGVIFKDDEEAAFAGFYLWDSIGYCIVFSYSAYICTYIKIYILLVVSTVGIIGYLRTEMVQMQRIKEVEPK